MQKRKSEKMVDNTKSSQKQSRLVKVGAFCSLGASLTMVSSLMATTAHATTTKVTTKSSKAKVSTATKTYLGVPADTQYGPVQVKITVSKGKITKVTVPVYPTESPRDQMINSQAIPMLVQEVIKAQSSKIYGITGASYTSQGFYTSLVSALTQAGLK
jgi:uncharacterized protein with FMN-binding domain